MTTQISCSKPVVGIVLFLSLMLNVFFGGMLVGKQHYGVEGPGYKLGKLIELFGDLSPASRDKAKAAVKEGWPKVQEQLKAVREKRDAIKKMLMQKDYDKKKVEEAMIDVRKDVDKLMVALQDLGMDIVEDLTPEERQNLIRKLPRPPAE